MPAFVCSHVFEDTRPILQVLNLGDEWQLLCGDSHSDGPRLVGMSHLIERDESLQSLLGLPDWWVAQRRTKTERWYRRPLSDEERTELCS